MAISLYATPIPIANDRIMLRPTLKHSRSGRVSLSVTRMMAGSSSVIDSNLLLEEWKNGGASISMPTFWKKIPAFERISQEEFLNYKWQLANTLRNEEQVVEFLQSAMQPYDEQIKDDILEGMHSAPMSVSLTPYVLSCINWANIAQDPLRKQFLPMQSQKSPDHPMLAFDSLAEQSDSPVPGIVHRYPHKALFLATTVCPIYCRFCTRSYSVGEDTEIVDKQRFTPSKSRWQAAFEYIAATERLEDVLVSGGDAYFLSPGDIELIGSTLLSIPHIRRIRFATRGLTAAPMRVLTDQQWMNGLLNVVEKAKRMGKQVSIQVHFNNPNELTWITELAALRLFRLGITLRNQTPLLKGVNDSVSTMSTLIRKLAYINIQPYYVFQGDMVKGVEDLRTTLSVILKLEKHIQGSISGYCTPKFMVDLPGGGGKRLACSFESYDPVKGIARYSAPSVKEGMEFHYYDPLQALPLEGQQYWMQTITS